MNVNGKLKVAIIGTGNIGTDLLIKSMRSPHLVCTLFAGRNFNSSGMQKANLLGVNISDRGLDAIVSDPSICDLVFDATSAPAHIQHWPILRDLGKTVIDLTPAKLGEVCVPAINAEQCLSFDHRNINMITCGGQASIPIAHALSQVHEEIEYIEVASSIASRSAGPATRYNIDEYIDATEGALKKFSGARLTKAILILNPAHPPIDMQTTIYAKVSNPDIELARQAVVAMAEQIGKYVPGYQVIVPPTLEGGKIVTTVRVRGNGDYLPSYAGNLDIINCAAVAMAEMIASRGQLRDSSVVKFPREKING
jgi:acetaldehyde dehydrogenase (acetylating)